MGGRGGVDVAVTWRCVWRGIRLEPGSRRLIVLRWLLIVIASLPAHAAARWMLDAGPARSPYFTLEPAPLPLVHLARLFAEIPLALPVAIASAGLAVAGEQILLGGALTLLGGTSQGPRVRVSAALRHAGAVLLRPFLVLVLCGAVAGGAGAAALRGVARMAREHGQAAGWSGWTVSVALPLLAGVLALVWMAAVGGWLLWSRALLAAGAESGALRAGRAALGVIFKNPFVALGFPMALTLSCLVASGWVLAAWLAAEPGSAAGVAFWAAAMLAVLAAQSFAWHWMVHTASLGVRAQASEEGGAPAPAGDQPGGPMRHP
jgi:hypothetical protein